MQDAGRRGDQETAEIGPRRQTRRQILIQLALHQFVPGAGPAGRQLGFFGRTRVQRSFHGNFLTLQGVAGGE